jgi:hypothetical protein
MKKYKKLDVYEKAELSSIDVGLSVDMSNETPMTLCISDRAEEFRIEIFGAFMGSAVTDAATAWKAALLVNVPRRISVDITRMTGYDHAGYMLLREMHGHGTHIGAGTPQSLQFLTQISGRMQRTASFLLEDGSRSNQRTGSKRVVTMKPRASAAGE